MREQPHSDIALAQARNLSYSLRRHYVDDFHIRHVAALGAGSLVLDLGGNRVGKRGLFDIEKYNLNVVYANLSTAKQPHVQAEAAWLPLREESFDAVVCSELLEHVPDPLAVLGEAHRVLRGRGTLLVCVPFLARIHGDPYDFGRYTDYYWSEKLRAVGFTDIAIEHQGSFWSVLVDMARDLAYLNENSSLLGREWVRRLISRALGKAKQKAVEWDRSPDSCKVSVPEGYSTGFGIRAIKE
ncbi:MAG: class I SAM-dependent methyltransferase [Desulfomonile tiedjei]|nr:class I SAM-dependent methyltransferase [Desulfomonile tiedjei]